MNAANRLANLSIRGGGDCTGIEDDNLALLRACFPESLSEEPLLDNRAVRVACPAPEIEKVECAHDFILFELAGNATGQECA